MDKDCGCCIFCGSFLPKFGDLQANGRHAINKRVRTLLSVKNFVLAKCKKTPYLYDYFANVDGKGYTMLCLSCVNWQRRIQLNRGKRGMCGVKPALIMDQFTSFMMQPGKTPFPDKRCILRMLIGLRRASVINLSGAEPNKEDVGALFLLRMMPTPVQLIISVLPEDIYGSMKEAHYPANIPLLNLLLKAWWEFNNKTVFFAHHMTAKMIRRMIKDEETLDA
jgi:hypothetical protein